jgi:hypothetical protein
MCSKQRAKQQIVTTFKEFKYIIRATDWSHVTPSRWMGQPHSCIHDYIVVVPMADGGEVIIALAMSLASAAFHNFLKY